MYIPTSGHVRTALNTHTVNYGKPTEHVTETPRVSWYSNGFIKPDRVVVNPAVDGYRKPSSYSCPASPQGAFWANCDFERTEIWSTNHNDRMVIEGGVTGRVDVETLNPIDHNVNNVRMKLLNNVRDEVFDVAMVLAEISGTAETLSTNLMRLARSMDQFKRRKPDNFFYLLTGKKRDGRRPTDKFLRESAGSYLEWKYGIMPTVYDIQGASKALDMSQDGSLFDNPPLMVARAVDRTVQRAVRGRINATLPGSGGSPSDPIAAFTVTDELKARLDYRVSGEGLRGLNRYGLGLGTVATVLFDKTPFSFVLNMAVPIAELIKAWTALAGVDVVGYSETRYRRVDISDAEGTVPHNWYDRTPVKLIVHKKEKAYVDWERNAYPYPPMPLPYVRNPVKPGNLATVLSLFTQLRKP